MTASLEVEDNFDFSKYLVKNDNNENPKVHAPLSPTSSEEPFDFSNYKVKESPTIAEEFKRHTARTASRIGESLLGFPGDVINFTKFLSEKLPKPPSFLDKELNFVQKAGKKVLESIPGSSELKELSGYLTSGFTNPKTANEELGDEITSLATVLINPAKAVSGFGSLLKTIGSSVAKASGVKGAGKAAELLGADEKTKNYTELGTLFITGLLGGKTAEKFVGEQYQKARSMIPNGTIIETHGLAKSLDEVGSQLAKGITTNTKNEVRTALNELKAKASGGAMEVEELVESFHNINERINSKKLFDELTSSEKKQLKSRYDLLKNEVEKEIARYGKSNPEFYKTWKGANEGYATIAQSKQVGNFIKSKTGSIPKHLAGSIAIDLFLGHPAAIPGVITGYSALKTGELLYRIAKSPKLREHYIKVIMEANNENLPGMINHLNALDKESKKIEKS